MIHEIEQALLQLAGQWRDRAATFRAHGVDTVARSLEVCAADLESGLQQFLLEGLTLAEAAEETGYSYSSLQKKVADGDIPNAGDKGSPRVRRKDLPYKGPSDPGEELGIAEQALLRRA